MHCRAPRTECPTSPLQLQRYEESDARASVYHSEREDTPPTSLVCTGLVQSSPCPPPSRLLVLFLSANCWRRLGLALFLLCRSCLSCLAVAPLVTARASPAVASVLFLVACLRCSLACGCPNLLLPFRWRRWWLALRAQPAWPLAVWGLASEAPERPSPSLPAHRTHLQLVLAFRVLLSCSQVLCFHVLPAR